MLWFGGFSGRVMPRRVPLDSRHVWPTVPGCWLVGAWRNYQVRATRVGRRSVAVIGSCGIQRAELDQLGAHGVPDGVAWRWPGSYTVVQVDEHGTTIWTDVGGASPIYTTSADGGVYWSSSARALAGLTDGKADCDWLAASLLAPAVPALLAERSAFAGVSLVPAGHRLFLPKTGSAHASRVWWPRPATGEHAARLRAELASAVAVRVDAASAPTADLSGGYDSSALALLAAERVSPDRTVDAVTVHPEGITEGGDLAYSHLVAEHPGISHRLVPIGLSHLPYSALGDVSATDEPAPSTVAHARFSAQLRWMREHCGSDMHMTGDGGDSLLCAPPLMLGDLLHAGRYGRAAREALAWARLRRMSPGPLLESAHHTASNSRAMAMYELAEALRTGQASGSGPVGWFHETTPPPWATREARERAATVAVSLAECAVTPRHDFTTHMIAETMANVGRSARADAQLAEQHGIALHNPFTDSRVVDAYLSVPLDARPGPAQYKPLLRQAMADLFPAELAARTTKGSYTSDYYGGMRANLDTLRKLADGCLAAHGLIDPGQLRQTLRHAAAGVSSAYVTVAAAITAEVWLRALLIAPVVPWVAAQPMRGAA